MKGRWLFVALGLTFLAFGLRVHRLGADSLWFDEASTARNLTLPLRQVISEAQSLGHVPYYLLLRLLPDLESSEFGLRYPSALFGVVGVAASMAAGRRIGDSAAGALAGLLLALSPMHIWFSREARTYAGTLAAALVAVVALLDLLRRPDQRSWGRLIAAQTLAVYAHLFAALANIWQTGYVALTELRRRQPRQLRRWIWSQLAVLVASAPIVGAMLWGVGQKSQLPWVERPNLFTLADLSLHLSGVKYLAQHNWASLIWLVWLALLVWGAVKARPLPRSSLPTVDLRLLLLSWAAVPLAVLFIVSWLIKPMYVHRYLLFTLPAYLLLISFGLARSRGNLLILLSGLTLLAGEMVAVRDVLISPAYNRPDWRGVQSHLARSVEDQDLVLFHPWLLKRPFDYYNRGSEAVPEIQLTTVGSPQGVVVVSAATLTAEMDRLVADIRVSGGRLWIVERAVDTRASDSIVSRNGWRPVTTWEFDGELWVHLYQFRRDG